jgi:CelD/BcsL family acetyltransferase involved in cellulose biosynthesis
MSAAVATSIIADRAGFAALEPEWWALWRRAATATPFQSPAWLLPWWDVFAPGDLHVAAVHRHGTLIALAPLYLERSRGRPPRLLPVGISISDYLDILLDPECREEAAAGLLAAMASSRAWEIWELADLAPHAEALQLSAPAGSEETRAASDTCPYLPLPERPEELAGILPRRKRRSLSMNRNRAERRGEVTFHSLADEPADSLLAELYRLHGRRWESRGEPGVLGDESVQRFHLLAVPRLAEAGLVRLHAIRIGGRTAAVYYGLSHGAHAYAYLTGLDPDFAHESPGTLLLAHVMEDAIAEGVREFHFLRGGEAYKYGWGALDRWNQMRVFNRRRADEAA